MSSLLVIGEATFDRLYFSAAVVDGIGGAGMYTTMAAKRCGVHAAMFGLRPDPCPEEMRPIAERLSEWLGLAVSPEKLPRFGKCLTATRAQ